MTSLALFAQAAEAIEKAGGVPTSILMLLAMMGIAGFLITATITSKQHATRNRELLHEERMKAIEKGLPFDELEDERRFRKGLLRLAFALGVVVPICAAGSATGAVTGMGTNASNMVVFLIWTAAASIGVAGVGSGAWLAQSIMTRFGSSARRNSAATNPAATSSFSRPYETPEAAPAR